MWSYWSHSGATITNTIGEDCSYDKKWNCPNCQMSSTRHWNMHRHIDRRHVGMGEPITDDTAQYYKDMNPQNFHFPFDYSHHTSLSFLTRKGKTDKKFSISG